MFKYIKNKTYKLLKKSEKWTKTDMIYLAKGSFWLTSNKLVGTITAFLLAVIYANFLPKETYATYKYVLSVSSMLILFSLTGIDISLTRSVARGYEGSFSEAIKLKLKWSLIGSLVGIFISFYYFFNKNIELGYCFLIAAVTTPFINSLVYGSYLRGKKLFKVTSIYNSLKNIISSIVIATIVLSFPKLITIVVGFYAINMILQFSFYKYTFWKYTPNNKKDEGTISYGKHLSLMNIVSVVAEQIDKILLWHFLGPLQLAIYSFATLPVSQAQSFLKSVTTLALPKMSNTDITLLKKTFPLKILKFTILLIPMVILYIMVAPFVYKIFFPQYQDSILLSQLFSVTLLFFPMRLISQIIIVKADTKTLYFLRIFNPSIKIILFTILIYFYGIYGLLYAIIISNIIAIIIEYYFSIIKK
ncbi:hypothetical protein C0583_03905 [Candidatus Parcubacteria bacterium]|mgnify:CR=1 FL=1|nr:MAG: hypothetical protein C0583_03905 [Candidatus Parcubacteria bacterium]